MTLIESTVQEEGVEEEEEEEEVEAGVRERERGGGGKERAAAVEEEEGDVGCRVASKDDEIMKRIKCVRSAIIVAVGR